MSQTEDNLADQFTSIETYPRNIYTKNTLQLGNYIKYRWQGAYEFFTQATQTNTFGFQFSESLVHSKRFGHVLSGFMETLVGFVSFY